MENVLATADFKLHGTTIGGNPYSATVHATLEKSAAFKYGNGTCAVFEWSDNPIPQSIDTRYIKVSPENFAAFAKGHLETWCAPTITVEPIGGGTGE